MSQCERIKKHLEEHGSITRLEAMNAYGVMNLWQRIRELEAKGMMIQHIDNVEVPNRYGEKCKVTKYVLLRTPQLEMAL